MLTVLIQYVKINMNKYICLLARIKNEKLRSEGVAMYAYILCVYQKSINSTWAGPFEISTKIELLSKIVIENKSHFFFDA